MKRNAALIPLSHDHHLALSRARKLRRAAAADARTALTEAQAFLVFVEGEIARDFDQEERFVFPLLPAGHLLVKRALDGRAAIRSQAAELRATAGPGAVSADALVRLADAFEAHIRFEERELFEEVQRQADSSALESVGRHLEADARPREDSRPRYR